MEVARTGRGSSAGHLSPSVRRQITGKEVRFALDAIISTVDVHVRIILGPGRAGSDRRQSAARFNFSPRFGGKIELPHVVEPSMQRERERERERE